MLIGVLVNRDVSYTARSHTLLAGSLQKVSELRTIDLGVDRMSEKWQQLLSRLGEIHDLEGSCAVLGWDQQTYMPPGGNQVKASQLATLLKLAHNMFVSDEMGELLEDLEAEMKDMPYDSFEAGILRVTRRAYDQAKCLSEDLVTELAKARTLAFAAWAKAKQESDFSIFRPQLEHTLELKRQQAEALTYTDTPYDALLRLYEPDLNTAQVALLFTQLRERQVPLITAIAASGKKVDTSPIRQHFPDAGQWKLQLRLLELMGFNMEHGRLDRAEHPFTTSFGIQDVRLTTHLYPTDLCSGLFSTIHEAGHGLYEQGIDPKYERTPLANGATLSVHESQSRLWENLIGRSRLFWQHLMPILREIFPQQMAGVNIDRMYQAVNEVKPSFIRVDADEATYNLHIFIRFELEQDLITGKLAVADLPEAWNDKYESYLGIRPSNDAEGVLQDVHWSTGMFGYFPTYALGNILSVQIWDTMKQEPDISAALLKGDFKVVRNWLRKNIHAYGRMFTTQEIAQRVTGRPLTVGPYLDYIETKYKELYGL
jgi:carboxypeptidase Taq